MTLDYLPYLLVTLIAVIFLSSAIRILREYQRGVIFTLGRFTGVKGPELIILVPFVQQISWRVVSKSSSMTYSRKT